MSSGKSSAQHSHHDVLPSEPELRVAALEAVLVRKGLVDPSALERIIDHYENRVGPRHGAKVVAKCWVDQEFREALLSDATSAIKGLNISGRQGEHVIAVENTPEIHNLVVCTLCSCYPWPLLGLPPGWYKSHAYRSRAVREPRRVLAEFGVKLLPGQRVRVWDSTSEIRYLVVPMRPAGTEGMDETELAALVSRDSMIGASLTSGPGTT